MPQNLPVLKLGGNRRRGAPGLDDGGSMFVAELAPGAGFELEETRGEGIEGEPAGC